MLPASSTGLPRPRPAAEHVGLDWVRMIDDVMSDPDRLTLVFQPIVNLVEATIVGYETLSRFEAPTGVPAEVARTLTPDLWFTAADGIGRGAEFEALVVARCLELRTSLPPDCFLAFNVSPLIVEFTEHRDVPDQAPLVRLRDQLAASGGLLALDDAGSGYSGLQQMTRLRPHLIKLDRALVANADTDEVKLVLAELLGEFAARIDAWLLAEGVETWGELDAFARIGVPLAQGFLLGRPAAPWATLDPEVAARLRLGVARTQLANHAAGLIETVWTTEDAARRASPGQLGLRLDDNGRPIALLIPVPSPSGTGSSGIGGDEFLGHREAPVSLRVAASDSLLGLARRLVTRSADTRFDPLVCIDERGRALGAIRVERVITQLARLRPGS